jgi:catechol 2,3-dioxygenase-like lactoylglutathione lyase family enzyme
VNLHHVALRTHDIERAVAFYRDVLGLAVGRTTQAGSIWLTLGHGAVLMIERAGRGEATLRAGSMDLLAFEVDARNKALVEERLLSRGVGIEARTEHTIYFRDPDGRRIGLSTHPLLSARAT